MHDFRPAVDHPADRTALHRLPQLPAGRVGLGRVHPAAHVRVDRHGDGLHDDLTRRRIRPLEGDQREVLVDRLPVWSADQLPLPGADAHRGKSGSLRGTTKTSGTKLVSGMVTIVSTIRATSDGGIIRCTGMPQRSIIGVSIAAGTMLCTRAGNGVAAPSGPTVAFSRSSRWMHRVALRNAALELL